MSDQVSQEFTTQVTLPGGSGITSINGDGTPAQLIVASTGIVVGNAGATHSIGNTGVLSVAKDGSPPRTGAIVLKPSASVTITEAPNGTYEFDAIGASGITSINADVTPAQVLAAGAGISITPGPAGTNTIAATGLGAGIISINADAAAAQTLVPAFPLAGVIIADTGAGAHSFQAMVTQQFSGSQGPGAALANGVLTLLSAVIVAVTGQYFVSFGGGCNGIAGQLLDMGVAINGVPFVGGGGFSGIVETAGQTLGLCGPMLMMNLNAGDTVTVAMNHHGGGGATTSLATFVQGFRLS